jgi:hypothetical protein
LGPTSEGGLPSEIPHQDGESDLHGMI